MSQEYPWTKSGKSNFMEDEITAMVDETEARQHVIWWVGKQSQTWERVCLYSEQGEEGTVVADIKKKLSGY